MSNRPRIVFMGSPAFALPALEALHAHYPVVGVVTQPDRPAGRGRALTAPPVKELAGRLGLPVIQPGRLREPGVFEQLRAWSPDLIVVAAFGQILRPDVLDLPSHGCVNVHASLLPRWRGAAPVQAAILAGDAESGVTIMKMDAGIDTGAMLAARAEPIRADDTAASLSARLAALGARMLIDTLPDYLSGALAPQPQPEQGVTYAPMLKKEDARLDFARPAAELERRVRAMQPWPGAFLDWDGQPLKVLRARADLMYATYAPQPPGKRIVRLGLPAVVCGDNALLALEEVQPAGKKPMAGAAFLAGARGWEA